MCRIPHGAHRSAAPYPLMALLHIGLIAGDLMYALSGAKDLNSKLLQTRRLAQVIERKSRDGFLHMLLLLL
jgi:hypothetical protein